MRLETPGETSTRRRHGTVDAHRALATRFCDALANEPGLGDAVLASGYFEAITAAGEWEGGGLSRASLLDGRENLSPALAPPGGLTAVTAHTGSACSIGVDKGHIDCTRGPAS